MPLTEEQALDLQRELERFCHRHGLWYTVEHQKKPALRMIVFKEISIKVGGPEVAMK
jgi:hypothetical protein